jgi:hypothetical protein
MWRIRQVFGRDFDPDFVKRQIGPNNLAAVSILPRTKDGGISSGGFSFAR